MGEQQQKRPFKIQKIHREAVRKKIEEPLTWQEIADELHVNRTTIWRWMKHPELRRYYERRKKAYEKAMRQELEEIIRAGLEKEFAPLMEDLHSGDPIRAYIASSKIIAKYKDILLG